MRPQDTPSQVDDLARLRALAADVDGLTVSGAVLHHTDKSITVGGDLHAQPVITKCLTSADTYWQQRRDHEVRLYRTFTAHPPPVHTPRLLVDHASRLTVVTRLPGGRLGEHRFLDHDPGPRIATQLIDAVRALSAWPAPWPAVDDDLEAIDREVGRGFLGQADGDAARALLLRTPPGVAAAHGDLLPTNILIDGDAVALVDWEHAGRLLPGYDLALLDLLAGPASPVLREAITVEVTASGVTAPFAVNLALLTARELRLHTALPHDHPDRAGRLRRLAGEAARASKALHALL